MNCFKKGFEQKLKKLLLLLLLAAAAAAAAACDDDAAAFAWPPPPLFCRVPISTFFSPLQQPLPPMSNTMSTPNPPPPPTLFKIKLHLGDLTAATLLPLSELSIETVLQIAQLEFPAQFAAAAASSDVISLFSFGTTGARFTEIASTQLLRSLFLKASTTRVYLFASGRVYGPPPLPPQQEFRAKKNRVGRGGGEDTVRLKLVKGDDVRCV